MKGVVGIITAFLFDAEGVAGVRQDFGKCPAPLPEATTFSFRPSVCSLFLRPGTGIYIKREGVCGGLR
jgi:hypothetical protein